MRQFIGGGEEWTYIGVARGEGRLWTGLDGAKLTWHNWD